METASSSELFVFSLSDKMSFAGLRPSPGRHCFHADFAQEHNTLIHVVVFLVSACLTVLWFFHASAHRNHGESWTRLVLGSCFCCIFFTSFFLRAHVQLACSLAWSVGL